MKLKGKTSRDKDYDQMFKLLTSAVKITRPSLTEEQATNVIINLANWKQLKQLEDTHD